MKPVDLLMTGTGSLAEAVLFDLVARPSLAEPMAIVLTGRNASRLAWLAQAANARACALETRHRVAYSTIDWDAPDDLKRLLSECTPKVVFHAASLQSMWEIARGKDAWAAEIRRNGYGVTLPLQIALALRVARAIDTHAPSSRLINACYPDASNEVLARLGYNVLCGIGNVAILAATYAVQLGLDSMSRLQLLAHHRHVTAAIAAQGRKHPPRVWVDGIPLEASAALPDVRLPDDPSLNLVTSVNGVQLIVAALDRVERYAGHAPGPLGLPGGYPVVFAGGRLQVRLPPGVTLDDAVASNRAWAREEGIMIDADGVVRIASDADATMLPVTYHINDIVDVARRMSRVKAEMQRYAN